MKNSEKKSLLERIEEVCRFDLRPLLERIRITLHLSPEDPEPKPVQTSRKTARLGLDTEELSEIPPKKPGEDSPFYISRQSSPLYVPSEKAFNDYKRELTDLRELEQFLQNYSGLQRKRSEEYLDAYVKLTEQMVTGIQRKELFSYQGENDAERLAEFVYKRILERHVEKISTALFRYYQENPQRPPLMRDLIAAMNGYLKRLGIYTVFAEPGGSYDEVMKFFETSNHGGNGTEDIIIKIERPAYVLEYIDEDDRPAVCALQGLCLLKERES